ncbi:glycosyl transferase family 8 protein [Loa loa]|nr:glycosyl transferase family 8 protein [Loa loa]EFO26269.1 glycosyl transferase family 8 protein [Loa loa]
MKKRKKRMNAYCIWVLVVAVLVIFYLSVFTEVSYHLHIHKRNTNLFEQFVALTNGERNRSDNEHRSQHCQVLHLALVVCGAVQLSYPLSTLIKSILRYRQQAIVLHLLVDDITMSIISLLFSTWRLPAVKVTFYNASQYLDRFSWIPNRHYSGRYGLLKLILNDILPADVDKVIALDTDVLIMGDIAQLWSFFSKMANLQAIGLVENLSDWYLFNRSTPQRTVWPAWGRGFNSGVMLLDLAKLRNMSWSHIWEESASKNVKEYGPVELADQDVINAVINDHRWIVQKLPCEWNFQLGFQSQQNLCAVEISHLKLVHWNSPLKTRIVNRYAVLLRRYYDSVRDIDGSMFRSNTIHCRYGSQREHSTLDKVSEYDDNDDGCSEIRHARWITYRTLLYVRPYNFTAAPKNVVLITQFSVDRLMHFNALLQYWTGPVSAAVYVTDSELSLLIQFFDDTLVNRTNVALHAVYKEGTYYPINYLRNVALNNSNDASFVFLADVDFTPAPGLYTMLYKKLVKTDSTNKRAFVVPAFEYTGNRVPAVPLTKNELLRELDARRMQIFRRSVWIQGHAATDYDRWRHADQEYSVSWKADYEPYVVVRRSGLPPYDQRFVGFGWNKVSHVMLLNAAGYEFTVLPDAFVVHQPHHPSFEMVRYRSLATYRKCLKALKGEFVRDLIREQRKNWISNFSGDPLNDYSVLTIA